MIATVNQCHLDVDNWKTGKDTVKRGLTHAVFHRWNELIRDRSAHDGVGKFESFPLR